jgi:hypothetical protein
MTDPFATPSDDPFRKPVVVPPGGDTPPPVYNAPPFYGTPPGQPPYGAPVYGAPAQAQSRNGFGVAALVLGVLSLVPIGGLLGIPGLVFGILGRKRVTRLEATNGGIALAGIITSVLGMLLLAVYVTLAVVFFTSGDGQRYIDCMDAAHNDQFKTQQCADQLARDLGFDPNKTR